VASGIKTKSIGWSRNGSNASDKKDVVSATKLSIRLNAQGGQVVPSVGRQRKAKTTTTSWSESQTSSAATTSPPTPAARCSACARRCCAGRALLPRTGPLKTPLGTPLAPPPSLPSLLPPLPPLLPPRPPALAGTSAAARSRGIASSARSRAAPRRRRRWCGARRSAGTTCMASASRSGGRRACNSVSSCGASSGKRSLDFYSCGVRLTFVGSRQDWVEDDCEWCDRRPPALVG
jgi:hypothetical protein